MSFFIGSTSCSAQSRSNPDKEKKTRVILDRSGGEGRGGEGRGGEREGKERMGRDRRRGEREWRERSKRRGKREREVMVEGVEVGMEWEGMSEERRGRREEGK